MVLKLVSFSVFLSENLLFPTPGVQTWCIQLLHILFLCEASMPPGLEAGKYFVGWKPSSSVEDMWFWVLQGTSSVSLSYSLWCQFRGDKKKRRDGAWGVKWCHLVKVLWIPNSWVSILGDSHFSWQNIDFRFRWFWLQKVSQTFHLQVDVGKET